MHTALTNANSDAERDQYETQIAKQLTMQFVALAGLYRKSVVTTAALSAAAVLILGRPLKTTDAEVQAAAEDFLDKLYAAKDVLREGATTMTDVPKRVM